MSRVKAEGVIQVTEGLPWSVSHKVTRYVLCQACAKPRVSDLVLARAHFAWTPVSTEWSFNCEGDHKEEE